MNTYQKVLELVATYSEIEEKEIGPDLRIFDEFFVMDSFAAIEFVLKLEQEFGIKIDDDDLDMQKLQTPRMIAQYVENKKTWCSRE
ncbi:hypothetical protein BC351_39055 [Paenibacillus ferrarius]|uniref:Carrier domain-containing protein n=1 Tax=Paenibacillus ferrarius TaxID=1469647 RepID=A0A1V4HA91_9BACL|nr:acyl carrier protein [Paenibacillus ferrarius]OPH47989.1 hypothetical protein BC351_39055 [Paenibacillus ferrarius]